MTIHEVFSVKQDVDNALLIDADFTGVATGERMRTVYVFRDGDEFGSAPMFQQWLVDNPDQEILPYELPPEPTPEELRELMPPLTSRQFWLAARTLGITEDMLLAATDDPEIIIEIRKTTEFHRTYDSVVMLAPLMDITPEQLDDIWMWAAAV